MDAVGSRYEHDRINRYNFKFPGVLSWWFQMAHTVDGKSPANQLIGTVVYAITYRVLYIPCDAGFPPSTVGEVPPRQFQFGESIYWD